MSNPVETGATLKPLPAPDLSGLPFFVRSAMGLLKRMDRGSLRVELPDGRELQFGGRETGPDAHLKIHDFALARFVLFNGHLGAAEAYLRGLWDSDDLTAFLQYFAENRRAFEAHFRGSALARFAQRIAHLRRRNSRTGSKHNIEFHYDLGNAFYEQWLDPTMTYSSARFLDPNEDLARAQVNKYRSLAEQIDLKPEHHVLEIGCGWGGFAEYAAGTVGARVTGITISQEQLAFAQERMRRLGLEDRVTIEYRDYRDVTENYDRIVSIEMIEAVGEEYWPAYFGQLHDRLKPGGRVGLQAITICDDSFPIYRKSADFIQRYIFPGGMLPSPGALREQVQKVGLEWQADSFFGLDYAVTLKRWRDRFLTAWPEIRPLGFDERFRRMWEYYLAYCEAGFRSGNIDVGQITLTRPA